MTYKKEWQKYYGEYPYSKTDERHDLSPEEYADAMLGLFESAGILDSIQQRELRLLASSVSTGKKDWELLDRLDKKIGGANRPQFFVTDFALSPDGKSVIEPPGQKYGNLDYHIVASDSCRLPFKDNFFDVLYERLGALYHAADEDKTNGNDGKLTRAMLEEYKRVIAPGGKIIIDWINSRISVSTAEEITEAVKEDVEAFFVELGFGVEFVGDSEGFIILTNPGKKSQE